MYWLAREIGEVILLPSVLAGRQLTSVLAEKNPEHEKTLEKLGREGWELLTVVVGRLCLAATLSCVGLLQTLT